MFLSLINGTNVSHRLHRAQCGATIFFIRLCSTLTSAFYLCYQVFSQKRLEIIDIFAVCSKPRFDQWYRWHIINFAHCQSVGDHHSFSWNEKILTTIYLTNCVNLLYEVFTNNSVLQKFFQVPGSRNSIYVMTCWQKTIFWNGKSNQDIVAFNVAIRTFDMLTHAHPFTVHLCRETRGKSSVPHTTLLHSAYSYDLDAGASIVCYFWEHPFEPLVSGTNLKTRWFLHRNSKRIFTSRTSLFWPHIEGQTAVIISSVRAAKQVACTL